jgi:hypothetical protein
VSSGRRQIAGDVWNLKSHSASLISIAFYRDGLGLSHPLGKIAVDAKVPAAGEGFRDFTLAHNERSPDEVDATLE